MAQSYSDVLASKDERMQTAFSLLDFLKAKNTISLDGIIAEFVKVKDEDKQRVRMILGFFVYHEIISIEKDVYTFLDDSKADDLIRKFLGDGNSNDVPADTQSYYKKFAFSSFVSSVAKWINHEGVVEREYDIDKLWTCPYIDFLDKCREYIAWRKSDQAILKSKVSKIKKQNGKKS